MIFVAIFWRILSLVTSQIHWAKVWPILCRQFRDTFDAPNHILVAEPITGRQVRIVVICTSLSLFSTELLETSSTYIRARQTGVFRSYVVILGNVCLRSERFLDIATWYSAEKSKDLINFSGSLLQKPQIYGYNVFHLDKCHFFNSLCLRRKANKRHGF